MKKLIDIIKALLQKEGIRYLLVGGSNTVLGWILSFLFTHLLHLGFWASSLLGLCIGGTYTYILNRTFTFRVNDIPHKRALPRFALNLGLCYFFSHVPAKAALDLLFSKVTLPLSADTVTFLKLLGANICFIVLNYIGQKFFAFRRKESE